MTPSIPPMASRVASDFGSTRAASAEGFCRKGVGSVVSSAGSMWVDWGVASSSSSSPSDSCFFLNMPLSLPMALVLCGMAAGADRGWGFSAMLEVLFESTCCIDMLEYGLTPSVGARFTGEVDSEEKVDPALAGLRWPDMAEKRAGVISFAGKYGHRSRDWNSAVLWERSALTARESNG